MISKNVQLAGKQVENLMKILKINKPVNGKSAVFFDIDGTISRNDNLGLLIAEIVKRDLLPQNKQDILRKTHKLWKSRELDFKDYLECVIDLIPNLKFFSHDILMRIAQDIIQSQGSHYYIFPWMLLLRLKALGYKLIAVSGAPQFMAKIYLDKIGIFPWEINGSKYIFKDHVFTGNVDLSILENKGDFIEKKYKNLFNMKNCIALGDTISDVQMFNKVGKVIAINPTYELALQAKKNKWPVVLERKDLVLIFPEGKIRIL